MTGTSLPSPWQPPDFVFGASYAAHAGLEFAWLSLQMLELQACTTNPAGRFYYFFFLG
jgi:hypothetical protein